MEKGYTTFEDILEKDGVLMYYNTGISMMPLLRQQRDMLVIKPKPEGRLKRLDIAFYKRDNGQYILHRVLWVGKNDYIICGDNQFYPERGISDRHILGVLDSVERDGVTYPLRSTEEHPKVSFLYKLYAHLWCDLFIIRAPIVFIISRLKRFRSHFILHPSLMYDYFVDSRICGWSLVKYVPSLYSQTTNANGSQPTADACLKYIFSFAGLKEGDSFLDVGCGQGSVLASLAEKGFKGRIDGIEQNAEMAACAQKLCRRYENVHVLCGNAFFLDYEMYDVLFLGRPLEPPFFHKFIEVVENTVSHTVKFICLTDRQCVNYLERRKDWKLKDCQWLCNSDTNYHIVYPQRFYIWEYAPQNYQQCV